MPVAVIPMPVGEYTLEYTNSSDPLKIPFTVVPNEINGPGEANTNTPLQLWGRYVVNYGQLHAQNYLYLLENFSSNVAPVVTTSGLLWFDINGGVAGEGVLRVRNTTNDAWIEVGSTDATTGGAGGKFSSGGSADFLAESGGNYFVDTSSNTVTVTLPLAPSVGDVVGVVDVKGTFDLNMCILNGNGNSIMDDPSNMDIGVEYARVKLAYSGSDGWRLI